MAELKSEKQEKFVQGLAKGLSQRVAYRAAFPSSANWKDSTVDVKACELAKNDKILVRLQELREMATSKAVMSATERKEWLTELIYNESEETKDRLKAMDILNRMDGEYTEKVDVNANVNNPFAGLETEDLLKLVDEK
jgi:phage terminase small subunit